MGASVGHTSEVCQLSGWEQPHSLLEDCRGGLCSPLITSSLPYVHAKWALEV